MFETENHSAGLAGEDRPAAWAEAPRPSGEVFQTPEPIPPLTVEPDQTSGNPELGPEEAQGSPDNGGEGQADPGEQAMAAYLDQGWTEVTGEEGRDRFFIENGALVSVASDGRRFEQAGESAGWVAQIIEQGYTSFEYQKNGKQEVFLTVLVGNELVSRVLRAPERKEEEPAEAKPATFEAAEPQPAEAVSQASETEEAAEPAEPGLTVIDLGSYLAAQAEAEGSAEAPSETVVDFRELFQGNEPAPLSVAVNPTYPEPVSKNLVTREPGTVQLPQQATLGTAETGIRLVRFPEASQVGKSGRDNLQRTNTETTSGHPAARLIPEFRRNETGTTEESKLTDGEVVISPKWSSPKREVYPTLGDQIITVPHQGGIGAFSRGEPAPERQEVTGTILREGQTNLRTATLEGVRQATPVESLNKPDNATVRSQQTDLPQRRYRAELLPSAVEAGETSGDWVVLRATGVAGHSPKKTREATGVAQPSPATVTTTQGHPKAPKPPAGPEIDGPVRSTGTGASVPTGGRGFTGRRATTPAEHYAKAGPDTAPRLPNEPQAPPDQPRRVQEAGPIPRTPTQNQPGTTTGKVRHPYTEPGQSNRSAQAGSGRPHPKPGTPGSPGRPGAPEVSSRSGQPQNGNVRAQPRRILGTLPTGKKTLGATEPRPEQPPGGMPNSILSAPPARGATPISKGTVDRAPSPVFTKAIELVHGQFNDHHSGEWVTAPDPVAKKSAGEHAPSDRSSRQTLAPGDTVKFGNPVERERKILPFDKLADASRKKTTPAEGRHALSRPKVSVPRITEQLRRRGSLPAVTPATGDQDQRPASSEKQSLERAA